MHLPSSPPFGICAYAAYVPSFFLALSEIQGPKNAKNFFKSVPDVDEDVGSFALNLSSAIETSFPHLDLSQIGSIYFGTESSPYAVRSQSAMVGQYFGLRHYTSASLEFACKSATAGFQIAAGQVISRLVNYSLVIGADVSQSRPRDELEAFTGAAAAAVLFCRQPKEIIAKLLYTTSYTSDTPDFWRRNTKRFPSHSGRFSGLPAYFHHSQAVIDQLLSETHLSAERFKYVVFHTPNLKFPDDLASHYQFSNAVLVHRNLFPKIGNSYSASTLVGLADALDTARPGDLILHVSYGSGSGSDGFVWQVTKNINLYRPKVSLSQKLKNRLSLTYSQYLTHLHLNQNES